MSSDALIQQGWGDLPHPADRNALPAVRLLSTILRYKQLLLTGLLLFGLLALLAGCQTVPDKELVVEKKKREKRLRIGEPTATTSLEIVPWSELPDGLFQDRALHTWAAALEQSAIYYRRLPAKQIFHFATTEITAATLGKTCSELATVARSGDMERLKRLLQERYRLYRAVGNSEGDVLVTAYYEPLLQGSLQRSKRYFYPIYRHPADLQEDGSGSGHRKIYRREKGKILPYYERSQIDGFLFSPRLPGKLANKGLELVWVDSAIDAFFLHIQGSGRVQLDNGQMMRIGYAGSNGRSYVAIGRILIDEGKIAKEEMTMPRLRQWLLDHPEDQQRLFFANPSYVFFQELQGDAVGNINVPLTAERSIATDHRLFPKGAPGILETTIPLLAADGKTVTGWRPDARWIVNQDTGGAIRGAGRVDLFAGFGENIEYRAGVMKQPDSQLFFIAPLQNP
ncbi:murein transglycosylase A [Candidatus Magnetaquicoccus inordinatus]|uniref:murein transglycosylase A n=1 Tax=Candidatus Magnetaquicoccus inordinatus TaxID=2496818 RepID=UPI00187D6448|nr:murein transglycosylase A [Candidatus Magnetaquicoccus inordinatus]